MRNPRALACGFRIFCLWRKSHEKIFPHFDGGVLLSFAAICKKAAMPEWVQNYRTVFPASEYLAQRGSGDSAEKARTDATAALSRYFKTSVNANLSTTMTSVTAANSAEEKTLVVDDVNVQSEVELFALEYTEPFYYKAEKSGTAWSI